MLKPSLAQVGQGDPVVLAHPGFRAFPPSALPLQTDAARAEYDSTGRLIWNAGRLSKSMHIALSAYASCFDQIQRISAEGLTPRASWYTNLQKAQARLKLDDIDKPISAPQEAPINRFAWFGFPNRR